MKMKFGDYVHHSSEYEDLLTLKDLKPRVSIRKKKQCQNGIYHIGSLSLEWDHHDVYSSDDEPECEYDEESNSIEVYYLEQTKARDQEVAEFSFELDVPVERVCLTS